MALFDEDGNHVRDAGFCTSHGTSTFLRTAAAAPACSPACGAGERCARDPRAAIGVDQCVPEPVCNPPCQGDGAVCVEDHRTPGPVGQCVRVGIGSRLRSRLRAAAAGAI